MPIPNTNENTRITDPKLPKDQLGSIQRSTVVHVLGEGEIEGFATASREGHTQGTQNYLNAMQKDIFLNGTPILKASANSLQPIDTDFNFTDVFVEERFGTSSQTHISGIKDIEQETTLNLAVENGSPVQRQVSGSNYDAVRVTLGFSALQKFEDNGDIVGTSVHMKIQIIQNNGTTTTPIDDTITGKSPSTYVRDYRINIPSTFSFPITIKVIRETADSTSSTLQNASSWRSFTKIFDKQNAYPNTAHVAVRVDAEQFPQLPRVMFKVRGMKIKIPHNATVRADGSLSFSGVFNGSLKTAKEYCNCPAWVLFNLLTESRYGFGDHISETQLDKFSFYSASVYNNELISNNEGGTEPRFSCNAVIQNQQEAYRLIGELCSVMRVQAYYQGGTIVITQDRPTDPSYLFTYSNVLEDGFSYTNTSKRIKYTIINIQFFDMETQEFDYETVEADDALKNKYGSTVKNIRAFAVTSRGQAHRLGKWFLYTQTQEGEVVSFTTTLEAGTIVRTGSVIKIADPVRSGVRRGGRIKAASQTQITVDDTSATDLPDTDNPLLSVVLPNGTVEQKEVLNISNNVISLKSGFSTAPNINSVWILENNVVETQLFRVVGVTEIKGLTYQITGVFHNTGKYAFVEDGTTLPTRTITTLTDLKLAPSNLQATERIVVVNNRAISKIFVTWTPVNGVNEYRVQYRFNSGNFVNTTVSRSDFEIFNSQVGTYEIRVYSYNAARKPSSIPATQSLAAVGKTAPPTNVNNLRMEPVNDKLIRLRWDQSTDVDVTHGGFCRIRHSPKTDGSGTFDKATDIDKLSGNSTQIVVPYIEGEYLIRFEDDTGNLSTSSSSIILDLPDPLGSLLVQNRREENDSPKFQGDKTNVTFDSSINSIKLTDPATNATGEYEFNDILDLGGVFSLDLKRHIFSEGFYANDLFDQRTALIDTWRDFDGASAVDVNAELLVAVTSTAPSGASYADSDFSGKTFNTFVNGTYKGRGFKFKVKLTANDPAQNIKISELGYTATFQRRQEQSATAIASGSAIKNITFDKPFFTGTSALLGANSNLPSIGITATDNITSGDYFQVTNISSTGFSVHFKNSSNASINRNFNFVAVGFGKGA